MTESPSNQTGNPHVFIDTGVFVYNTRLLSTTLGAAFIYSLARTGYKLALPEVIELEVRKHTRRLVEEAISDIAKGYRLIEMTMGSRDDYRVPSDEQIEACVDERFEELRDFITRVPFTLQHAKGAMERVIEETPPNRPKDQQFKDSAIWEAILELSEQSEVHLVTEDKSFFKDRNPSNGLASNPHKESEQARNRITVHYRLPKYLDHIRDELPLLDESKIANSIAKVLMDSLLERAADKGYQLGELFRYEISAFVTEQPQILAVDFQLSFEVKYISIPDTNKITDGVEIAAGNCSINTATEQPEDIQINHFTVTDLEGRPIPGYGHVFLRVNSAVIGRRTIPYTLREGLPGSE